MFTNNSKTPKPGFQGDNATPMMCEENNRWYVVGQAFALAFACGNNTSVFSRTSAFTDFIETIPSRVEGKLHIGLLL